MNRFIACLLAILFLSSVSLALTVESDVYSTNKGGISGKFTKTKTPLTKQIKLNGYEAKIATADAATTVKAYSCNIAFVPGATTSESFIYIIGKTTAGATCFRTLSMNGYVNDQMVSK